MSMRFKITVTGHDVVSANINRIGDRIGSGEGLPDQVLKPTLTASQTRAMNRARVRTGFMKSNIKYYLEGPGKGRLVSEADYSLAQNFGTSRIFGNFFFTDGIAPMPQEFRDNVLKWLQGIIAGR